jgi:type I restriction enzyme S subunit
MSKPPLDARGRSDAADWFGVLPYHWSALAIKRITPVKRGASPRPIDNPIYFDENGEYGWVRISDVTKSGAYLAETEQRLSDLGASLSVKLTPGSLFLSIAGSVGKACIANAKVCIHDGFVYFPNLRVNPRWLFQIFESSLPFAGLGKLGTQLNLNTDTVASIKIPIPPSSEIEHILGFLDTETAKIDHLIQKQERLIELLQEKRQAVISHAVTKGLDPTVPMKDSGIELLDMVPAHWKICPLKHLTPDERQIMYGIVLPGPHSEGGVPIVKGGDVAPDRLKVDLLNRTTVEIESNFVRSRLRGGDIVYAIRGSIGAAAIVPVELEGANLTQDAARISPHKGCLNSWLLYALKSVRIFAQLDASATGATIRGINIFSLKRAKLAMPPYHEQEAISLFLDLEISKIDDLNTKAKRSIDLMKERRSALISAAVTGKIDVREEA